MKTYIILFALLAVMPATGTQAQLYYKPNNSIWVGDSVTSADYGLNSRNLSGLYWRNGHAFMKMDCTPVNPRLAFSGNHVVLDARIYAGSYYIPSDSTRKTDIHPLTDGGTILASVSPYVLSAGAASSRKLKDAVNAPQDMSYCVSADALREFMPGEVITIGDRNYINYTALIPVLVSGIQSLRQSVEERQREIDSLKESLPAPARSRALGLEKTAPGLECEYRSAEKAYVSYQLPSNSRDSWIQLCDARGRQTRMTDVSHTDRMTITPDDIDGNEGYCTLLCDGKVLATVRVSFPRQSGSQTR